MAEFSGQLTLRAEQRSLGRTVLAAQSFRAPYHISKPYWDITTGTLLVQVVNPTAGILAGDRLESDIVVAPGAALLVTTPSATRVFKMNDGSAQSRQCFQVVAGGWLEVWPEPLVPHRACRYTQTTRVDVAVGGEIFFADLLLPGRVAHGEAWAWDRLVLRTEVWREGELLLRERFDQSGGELQALAELAGSGAGACFGNAVLIAEEDAVNSDWRQAVAALHGDGVSLGVSALRQGGWSIKFVAKDGVQLRRTHKAIRRALAERWPHLAADPRKL